MVHVSAPAGACRNRKPVAAPCPGSTVGAVQLTMRSLPVPCTNTGIPGTLGGIAAGAAVSSLGPGEPPPGGRSKGSRRSAVPENSDGPVRALLSFADLLRLDPLILASRAVPPSARE